MLTRACSSGAERRQPRPFLRKIRYLAGKIAVPCPASVSSCPSCLSLALGVIDLLNSPDYASTRFHTDYVLTTVTSYLGRYAYIEAGYTF